MSKPDMEYFAYLKRATSLDADKEADQESVTPAEEDELEFQDRIHYIINRIGHQISESQIPFAQREAIRKKKEREQAEIAEILQRRFIKKLTKGKSKEQIQKELTEFPHPVRTENAKWHITCYDKKTKRNIQKLMKKIKCKDYKLYSSIDECLAPFRINEKDES